MRSFHGAHARNPAVTGCEEDGCGRQDQFYKGRVDVAAGEPNDRGHGYHRSRSERTLGSVEGIIADPGANPLVKAVATDFSSGEARTAARDGLKAKFANSQPADVKTKSIDALRQISAVLTAKAPGDAAAFKNWLRQISQHTAEAAKEGGGLLGLGGIQVSEAEKATLAEISSALGA
jgi:hypothetical protein